jgi:hypothetical protein
MADLRAMKSLHEMRAKDFIKLEVQLDLVGTSELFAGGITHYICFYSHVGKYLFV